MPSLFELPDPFATMRYRMRPPSPFAAARMGQGAMQQQQPGIPDVELGDDERESLLRSMTRKTLGGVSAAANLLDLPDSVFRDVAGLATTGNFSKYNPLDQLLPWNWTSSEGRATGRDLGREWGMMDQKDTWGNLAGGIGIELALSPGSWLSGGLYGAATKGGRLAKMAGVGIDDIVKTAARKAGVDSAKVGKRWAARTVTVGDLMKDTKIAEKLNAVAGRTGLNVADVADDPLRSAFGVTIPFTSKSVGNIGTGAPNTGIIADLIRGLPGGLEAMKTKTPLDVVSDAVRWSPAGKMYSSLMRRPVLGRVTQKGQQFAERLYNVNEETRAKLRGDAIESAEILRENKLLDGDTSIAMRKYAEGVPVPGIDPAARKVAEKWRDFGVEIQERRRRSGRMSSDLDDDLSELGMDPLGHMFRQSGPVEGGARTQFERRAFQGKTAEDAARKEALKGFAEGTEGFEKVVRDKDIDTVIKQATDAIDQQKAAMIANGDWEAASKLSYNPVYDAAEDAVRLKHGTTFIQEYIGQDGKRHNRTKEIAAWLVEHPERRGVGLFTNNMLADANKYAQIDQWKHDLADNLADFVAESSSPYRTTKDGVSVEAFLTRIKGLNLRSTQDAAGNATRPFLDIIRERMGLPKGTHLDEIATREIPADVAADIAGLMDTIKGPEALKWYTNLWDSANSLFKVGVLTWPARFFRDRLSGAGRNLEKGLWDPITDRQWEKFLLGNEMAGAADIKPVRERLIKKGIPANAITDADATRELRIMYAQYGPGSHNIATETIGGAGAEPYMGRIESVMGQLPTGTPTTSAQWWKQAGRKFAGLEPGTTLNPLDVRGVGQRTETTFGPAVAGDQWSRHTDDMNRGVPWLKMLKQGWDPQAAMKEVNFAQVNYDPRTFTPTERVLKRLLPFYSFLSRNSAYVAHELATRPGGAMAQQIKLAADLKEQNKPMPEYVANTLAIPMRERADGSKRFLTGLGAMWEPPLQFLGGGARGGILEFLSQLAPGIQFPISWATGQSFFQTTPYGGRLLEDTDPTIARTIANVSDLVTGQKTERVKPLGGQFLESLAMASPLSRALTTARTLSDFNRKGIGGTLANVLTGFRVSDISPAAQMAMIREALQSGDIGRKYSKWYIPADDYAKMSPLQQAEARGMKAINKLMEGYTKETKKGGSPKMPF